MSEPVNHPNKSIFVANINYRTTEQEFQEFLTDELHIDTFTNIKVLREKETQRSRGALFVDFENLEDAAAALFRINGVVFGGRQLFVDYAKQIKRY